MAAGAGDAVARIIMEHHSLNAGHRAMTTDANRLTLDANVAGAYEMPPRVPVSHIRAFAKALDRLGFDSRLLLSVIGLRARDLEDPDATISASECGRFICAATEECRTPNLGAHVAAATPIGAFPLLDYLVVTTDTVSAALDQLVRYFHVVAAPMTLSVVRDDQSARLVVHGGDTEFGAQYETTLTVHHLRAETEQRLRVTSVSLICEPEDRKDLERVLGCKVSAPSSWNGVEFPVESLRLPLRRRDSGLRGVLEAHAASLTTVEPHGDDDPVVRVIRAELATRIGKPLPSLETLARQLAKAPRSLQRHLAARGLSYQQILDDTRREGAERLLADATLSIGEIGYLLGFSEPSAFHRAFKRWHDVTPQEYRARHLRKSTR
jgi:AraC-like DNA-binding protein